VVHICNADGVTCKECLQVSFCFIVKYSKINFEIASSYMVHVLIHIQLNFVITTSVYATPRL
jgi:hypothetical protein